MDSYKVELTRQVHQEFRQLPGNVRQHIIRILQTLRQTPRPHHSHLLDVAKIDLVLAPEMEPRRIRMNNWRILYVIEEDPRLVSIVAIRKRPPYQYEDLEDLLQDLL